MNWHEAAAEVRWNIQPFINGRYQPSASKEMLDHFNPATEALLWRAPAGDATDIEQAVAVARRSFNDGVWSELRAAQRGEVLIRLADLLVQHQRELALLDTLEMGKPIRNALYDANTFAPALLRSWAGFADKLLGAAESLAGGTLSLNTYEPRGVIAAITPWNFPTVNAVYKLGPALAAGNTAVLKPSELSPSSALRVAELALEAGVPEGVLNVVPGLGGSVGQALASHRDVDMVSFTGSTGTGRKIMELCARSNGKPVLLECGGKSPHVVFEDVEDLDCVADGVVQNLLWNQGQVCSAHSRLLVHSEVKTALLEKVLSRIAECQPGDPLSETTTFGPLASAAQRERVRSCIARGIEEGARVLLRGRVQDTGGCYVWPTVLDCPSPQLSVVQEEIFGPVLCIQEFGSDEEALALANGTAYALAATLWTRDLARGRRLGHAIRAAGVMVRTGGEERAAPGFVLSFEPQKASGFGAEIGLQGLQSYSTLKRLSFTGA
jgi:acyl-CoA reductase-like NAD-dependent aldehyde dehydrogenase